ncbi:MAG: type II secretion system F family protein [Gammaproteobacteria bacterium]|nr:type II secretion system F family protein [Gammaproteobacteria bacterium]
MAVARSAVKGDKKSVKTHNFAWEGYDKKGKKIKGESRGANTALMRAELRRQGINPTKVRVKRSSALIGKKKITAGDIALFSRQLATMMEAGVPMVQSFEIVGRGHTNPAMSELILTIKNSVEGGTSLALSLGKHPLYFDDLFCNLVHAGETAGILDDLLDKIATYKEKTEAIKAKIRKAMYYPVSVIVVAFVVTALLMIFVIPQFQELFQSFGADLPAFTLLVIGISEWMQSWWWALVGGIGGTIYLISNSYKRSRKMRHTIDRMVLVLPIIGPILHKAAQARFARTLSTMFAAGVPLVEALESVAGATGNIVYSDAILRIREDVATGQSLELAIRQQNLFPHMVLQMVSIGEESGSLDAMLAKVADFYEAEVDNAVDSLSSLMEPIIMVVIGTLVGGMIVAMYLPIFKMAAVV